MTRIYGVISTKGGTGKTTLCANTGGILADLGQKTLMIDTDPQGSLSRHYPLAEQSSGGLTRLITTANPDGCVSSTLFENLDIIQSDDPKADRGGDILPFLQESTAHVLFLRAAIQQLQSAYDYILIDSRGASGLMLEAVIYAADTLLSPIPPNYIDAREFVTDTVALLQRLGPAPGFPSITGQPLPNLLGIINRQSRTTDAETTVNWLRQQFDAESDGQISISQTFIPDVAAYNKAAGRREPVHRFEETRRGNTRSAHDTFLGLVQELSPRLMGKQPCWAKEAK